MSPAAHAPLDGRRHPRRGLGALERRNDFLAELLDGAHHLVMRNGLRLHNQHDLIHPNGFVHLAGLDARRRVPSDDHPAVRQGRAVELGKGGPRRAGTRIQGDADVPRQLFVFLVGLPEPAAKVGLEVVRDAAPGFQQLLIGVNPALNSRACPARRRSSSTGPPDPWRTGRPHRRTRARCCPRSR